MKEGLFRKGLVLAIIVLFIGASIAVVAEQIETEKLQKDLSQQAPIKITAGKPTKINITAGKPTKTGKWTVYIGHANGTTKAPAGKEGIFYEFFGYPFIIETNKGMTAADKAKKMRDRINTDKVAPLTAISKGANITVTPNNGEIKKWSSKSTDGQKVSGKKIICSGFSFLGTPSTGSVSVVVDECTASTTTDGKTLEEIHMELVEMSLAGDVLLDPSGLALYVFDISEYSAIDSDDDGLSSLGVFSTEEMTEEPFFDVYVSMQGCIVETPGSTVTTSFTIDNFRFLPDTYEISVTDTLGWEIDPHYLELEFEPGQSSSVEIDITIPPDAFTTENIVSLTATSLTEPCINSSGLLKIIVNSPPEAPSIIGPTSGKVGIPHPYMFNAVDPDDDDVRYIIVWDDGDTETTAFYPPGTDIQVQHTWTEQGTYTIRAKAEDLYDAESDWTELSVSMPKNKAINTPLFLQFLQNFFERYPNLFPILQTLLQRSGL